MTEGRRRPRIGRSYRRLRRWARHTPNVDIALVLAAAGLALVLLAAVLAVTVV